MPIKKILSGGQTGVDRAALDIALEWGIPCGGWCPRGRLAEDGIIPTVYPLRQTRSADYAQRTERNVVGADATLIITRGPPTGGTALTLEIARGQHKPYHVVDLHDAPDPRVVSAWLSRQRIETLNIAGPRESRCRGIYEESKCFLRALMRDARVARSSRRGHSAEIFVPEKR